MIVPHCCGVRAACQCLLSLALLAATCCWGAPKTHQIVPVGDDTAELQSLAEKVGTAARVITIAGEQVDVTVMPGEPGALHGRRLDGDHGEVSLPFGTLASASYTEPSTNEPDEKTNPRAGKSPLLPEVGEAEGNMTCPQLDTELARAEAIRWYARSDGTMPSERIERDPSGEFHRLTKRGVAADVAVVVACTLAGASPIGFCQPKAEYNPAVRGLEAIDDRIVGLLLLKAQKTCDGRATVQPSMTDLDIWKNIHPALESLVGETAALDLLGPKPQPVQRSTYGIEWIPNVGHSLDRRDRAITPFWKGSMELTDREAVVNLHERDRGEDVVSVEDRSVRLPYAAITGVAYDEYRGDEPVIVVRWNSGELGSLRLADEPGVRSAQRSRELHQLRRDVQLKASTEKLVNSRPSESSSSSSEVAVAQAAGAPADAGSEAAKRYDYAKVFLSGRHDRGAVLLTRHQLVLATENVPYSDVASVQLSAKTVALSLTSGRKITLALFSDDAYLKLDPGLMRSFRNDLQARMTEARP